MINSADLLQMMSKEGPIISVVVLRAKGKAIEKVFLC